MTCERFKGRLRQWLSSLRRCCRGRPSFRNGRTQLVCYRAAGDQLASLDPADTPDPAAPNLPETLFISPGTYRVDGRAFRLDAEGVYRFYALGRLSAQRVVSNADAETTPGLLAWLWSYGNHDDVLSLDALQKELRCRAVEVTCTASARLCCRLLAQLGIPSREVLLLTLDPWDNYDNGHTLVEIHSPSHGWFAFDPSFKCLFRRGDARLSLASLAACATAGDEYVIERVGGATPFSSFRQRGYDFRFWVEHRLASEPELRRWLARTAGAALIGDAGAYCFTTDDDAVRNRVMEYPKEYVSDVRYLPPDEFQRRFYGPNPASPPTHGA